MTQAGARILVVDDEPMLREIMLEWLEYEGFRVLTTEHGAEALKVLEKNPVDVIVTDIRMPVMDGITLLQRLKSSGAYAPAALFVSGFSDTTIRDAYDLGAEAILSKPFTDEQLLSAVRRILTPREELWRMPEAPPAAAETIRVTLPGVESDRIAFGRGGFCLHTESPVGAEQVAFELDFTAEGVHLAGHGTVRWTSSAEQRIGIEIAALEPGSMAEGIRLTTGSTSRCYIPRSTPG